MLLAWLMATALASSVDCGLVLELAPNPAHATPARGLRVTATLTNRGTRPVTLVMPGDGSENGRRTPVVTWSYDPHIKDGGGGCGNINTLKPGEVFTLDVGQSRDLGEWIRPPVSRVPRRFRAHMTYWNDPRRPWGGIPLGEHDKAEMAKVRDSDACFVRSNTIEAISDVGSGAP